MGQVRLAKDRKKGDKIVTDSQERAYWRAYRPPPGFFNCLELPPYPNVSSTSGGLLQTGAGCAADDASSPDACGSSSTHRKLARRWRNTEEIKAEVSTNYVTVCSILLSSKVADCHLVQ
jgi:ABC-type multidrug transport system permease subunit